MNHAPALRLIALFDDLSDGELALVAEACTVRTYPRHAHIVNEQEHTTDIFFILSGTVRFSSYTANGREVIFDEIAAGGLFGEFSAIDRRPRSSNVTALSDCTVARLSSEQFRAVLLGDARVATRLAELLVAKIRQMSERVFEVSALAVRERVRRELLRLAASGTRFGNSVVIRPAPTHYDIAARIGSHREAVTREFMHLEHERLIEVRRRQIRIVDIDRLAGSPDEPPPTQPRRGET
ncbi:MAG: Crp/Fnr family transcriptional regulator [Reyranellaceae bacterium]